MIRRWLIIMIVLFLIGVSHMSFLSTSIYKSDELGIFFDSLDDDSFIDASKSYGYKIENGYATIDFAETSYIYDCASQADKIEVSYRNNTQPLFILNSLFGPEIFGERNFSNLDSLKAIDDVYFKTESSILNITAPLQHYRFKIDQDSQNVSSLIFEWFGRFSGYSLRVYARDYYAFNGKGIWRFQGQIFEDSDYIGIGDMNPCRFVSKDGYVDIVLTPWPYTENNTYLWTDYISLEVREVTRKNATIVTKPIDPSKVWMWEYVVWEENLSDDTSIKVQVLDGNGEILSDEILEGNSIGFKDEVIPLYGIGGRDRIRLKFILETTNPASNPKLLSYMVLWQTDSKKWKDDLSTNYRLEEKTDTKVVSKLIYLPKGYWWKEFQAKVNLSGGGKVTFDILNDKGENIIGGIEGKSSIEYNISTICTRSIKLQAKIEKNGSFIPKIEEWSITFSREKNEPILKYPSIIYLNKGDLERGKVDIGISAKDDFPGICPRSAKFRLEYIDNLTGIRSYWSDWISAEVDGKDCSKDWVNIIARNIPIFCDDSLKDVLSLDEELNLTLSRVQFKIEDMARNVAESDEIKIEIDTNPPDSWITTSVDQLGFEHGYEDIEISADAVDDISNVKSVTLYYRISKNNTSFSDPKEYSSLQEPPWTWTFVPSESGYYKFFTVAEDNAGNVESIKDGELTLLIDTNAPNKPDFENKIYWMNNSKIDFVEFSDDLSIDSIEYRIGGEEYFEWKEIARYVDSDIYAEEWQIDTWDWEQMENGRVYPIYFRIRDIVGNEYVTPNDGEALKIAKDTLPPYPSIETLKLWQSKIPVEISTYISNSNGSEISKAILLYRYSPDKRDWSEWKEYNETKFSGWHTWLFSPEEGDGYYEVRLRAYDSAGNFADSDIISFGLTVFPEKEMISLVSIFVIFLMVSAFVTRKWD